MASLLKSYKIMGTPVMAMSLDEASNIIYEHAKKAGKGYVCIANVHMLVTAKRDNKFLEILEKALFVTSDGMPLVWLLKNLGYKDSERVAGPDLMINICKIASKENLSVFFYGGNKTTANALTKFLSNNFPELVVAGIESPPQMSSKPEIDPSVVDRIIASKAKIVFVGLGCPKQEYWMAEYSQHLPATLIGVGAAFDFMAGTKKRAPLWMQRYGLEWLFRLMIEPGRLWKRYFMTNSLFVYYLIVDYIAKRKTKPS